MKVAMIQTESESCVGIFINGRMINYSLAWPVYAIAENCEDISSPCSIQEMLEDGDFCVTRMKNVVNFLEMHNLLDEFTVKEYKLEAPISRPPKIVALGKNYRAHAEEMGDTAPTEPILFCKASTSVVGPDDEVIYYKDLDRVDHEAELAVVIGKNCRRVTRESAMDYVAGYTLMNDVTARNMQAKDVSVKNPWFRSKSLDTYGPLGPWIVTADEIADIQALDITCRVNGEIRQHSNTKNMLFGIAELIENISHLMTLEPGDVISTGTPEGISPVYPGDVMEVCIDEIGILRNPVAAEK